jgi:hypothetical protein
MFPGSLRLPNTFVRWLFRHNPIEESPGRVSRNENRHREAAHAASCVAQDNGFSSPRIVGMSSATVGWICIARCSVV